MSQSSLSPRLQTVMQDCAQLRLALLKQQEEAATTLQKTILPLIDEAIQNLEEHAEVFGPVLTSRLLTEATRLRQIRSQLVVVGAAHESAALKITEVIND